MTGPGARRWVVAPLEWVSLGLGVFLLLLLLGPWYAVTCSAAAGESCPPGGTIRGTELALAVVATTLLLLAGCLPVLRFVDRAVTGRAGSYGPVAPLLGVVGAFLMALQLLHDSAMGVSLDRRYGLVLGFFVAVFAGAACVLGFLQVHGRLTASGPPPGGPGAPARPPAGGLPQWVGDRPGEPRQPPP